MAHNGSMVWQANVLGIVFVVLALGSAWLLLVDDEGPLDIDAHISRVQNGFLDVTLGCRAPGTSSSG